MIGIVDYGVGNLKSLGRMIEAVGGKYKVFNNPSDLPQTTQKLILPGVGSFDYGIEMLRKRGWEAPLNEFRSDPSNSVLGVCLGMHLMCTSSEEGGQPGLGWFDASVVSFKDRTHDVKVPHMGWNVLDIHRDNYFFGDLKDAYRFYFVHSYFVECGNADNVVATTTHGIEFSSVINRDNLWGMQFHPEKSHRFGKQVFSKFVDLQ